MRNFNPSNAELHPICHLLTSLGAHHILHVSRIRVKLCYVIGVDKASYHHVLISPVPTFNINICKTGLVTEIMLFIPTAFTAKLFQFVRLNKPELITYKVMHSSKNVGILFCVCHLIQDSILCNQYGGQ